MVFNDLNPHGGFGRFDCRDFQRGNESRVCLFHNLLHIQFPLDAEFFDAFAQGRAGDAEHFGGVNLVVVRFLERLDDEFAFDGGDDF